MIPVGKLWDVRARKAMGQRGAPGGHFRGSPTTRSVACKWSAMAQHEEQKDGAMVKRGIMWAVAAME